MKSVSIHIVYLKDIFHFSGLKVFNGFSKFKYGISVPRKKEKVLDIRTLYAAHRRPPYQFSTSRVSFDIFFCSCVLVSLEESERWRLGREDYLNGRYYANPRAYYGRPAFGVRNEEAEGQGPDWPYFSVEHLLLSGPRKALRG